CVNAVGVMLNTASPDLLTYVSGLGPQLATGIVTYREKHGPFQSRRELLKVPRLGEKAFQQCAGFLRIRSGKNPLDASAVHPENYAIVENMAQDAACSVEELIKNPEIQGRIDLSRYVAGNVGMPTLEDIRQELARPGRDPREILEPLGFDESVQTMEDLLPGMMLPGIVTNVTAFGAFVDIGVHQDGLVHISKMGDRFISTPTEVVKVGEQVSVVVLGVDLERKRISLSMHPEDFPKKSEQERNSAEEIAP
ncbi:MAG TPA: helix-hairpin-helix domain-containing protein, partial [Synergistaceae bacterium]|nr:helix-hairpin-helix domain-containing protein [Synergistaceae bacterium]